MSFQLSKPTFSHLVATAALISVLVLVGACASTQKADLPKVTEDGLTLIEGTDMGVAYMLEGAFRKN